MKKIILRTVYYIIVFITACFVAGIFMNKGSDDMTAAMSDATFPVMTMTCGGQKVDCLYGYAEQMMCQYMRDDLMIIDDSRKVSFQIDGCSKEPAEISFEVRSLDGSRLIENTKIKDYKYDGSDTVSGSIVLKDLIEPEQEYMLVYLVKPENPSSSLRSSGGVIRYYTRIKQTESSVSAELKFVRRFHEDIFDKKKAEEITTYLESDSTGDNSTLNKVDIHSSFNMITWDKLAPKEVSEPAIDIKSIDGGIGEYSISYIISAENDSGSDSYYQVDEYYRLRKGKERIYLLDYERTAEQIFSAKNMTAGSDTINVGVESKDMSFSESDGGNVFAFVNDGTLYSYNVTDNKMIRIFGFGTDDMKDMRTNNKNYGIKIINVDETGNVQFAVYGYMVRGMHEGHVGAAFYSYSSMQDTVEENVYVDSTKSVGIISRDVEKLSYVNKSETCYVLIDGSIYAIDMTTRESRVIVSGLNEDRLRISGTGETAAWQENGKLYSCGKITFMNLNDGTSKEVTADSGDYIMPLGFMKENLVYGMAHASDITADSTGSVTFPMYRIEIIDEEGRTLKKYEKSGVYTVSCAFDDNQMDLKRVSRNKSGDFYAIADDQIVDTDKVAEGSNSVISVKSDITGTQTAIQVKKEIDSRTTKYMSPGLVLYEGSREAELESQSDDGEHYYVYTMLGLEDICTDPADAVNIAYADSGTVTDDYGRIIWSKTDMADRNQIMAIKAPAKTEASDSVASCIDAIMQYNGVSLDSGYMISQGRQPVEIIGDNIPDIKVLDLTGCSLDEVMYYVNNDIPVMAINDDGKSVLLTGFNSAETVVYDPTAGTLSKTATKSLAKELSKAGCSYITYISTAE